MTQDTILNSSSAPTRYQSVDGADFAYRDVGPREGTPVVFLHHFTATIDDWDPRVVDGIASQRRVIVFDNRGVGGSEGRVPAKVDAMAGDAIAFIRALGLDQVDLFGFSLGGFVAQVIAAREPDLVRRIVLTGTGPAGFKGVGTFNRRLLADSLRGAITLTNPKPLLFLTRTANGEAAACAYMSRLHERTSDRVKATSLRGAVAQLGAIGRWGARDPLDLSAVTHPALVANGEDDRMVATRGSFELAYQIPNAELVIYPDAGHGGVFQHHDRFVPKVLEFLG
ncbi:alpha/beta hydrolase [Gordonia sp. HY442]|uniref:alpha/beta fold hydrolase n=1 Tax=Gordonia zhenghanii TaxID=2911516 RepID=UPI001F2C2450|nr:alpha/beta hydrolase [Gordonia zhenghanii]MCF8607343.1 alpha/beta hydrolase [Gordonia zhenghanii]